MQIKELVEKDFLKIDKKEPISKLVGKLKNSKNRNALVFDKDKFLGIISKGSLLRSKVMADEMKISKVIKPIATISEEADVLEAAYLMFNVDTNILPVEKKGKITGVLRIFDLLGQWKKFNEIRNWPIKEVKIEKIKKMDEDTKIGEIIHEMHEKRNYGIPITDETGKLKGMISVSDIYNQIISPVVRDRGMSSNLAKTKNTKAFKGNIPSIMEMPAISFGTIRDIYYENEGEKVTEAIREMRKHNVMSIVVMKNEKPIGVVTANGLLRAMAALYKGPEYNIRLTGIKKTNLEPYQVANIKKILNDQATVFSRWLKNEFVLRVDVKEYKKDGKRHKWSVMMKLIFPGRMIQGDEHDWDIETALRKAFNNVKKQVKHAFPWNNRGWRKPYE